MKGLEFYFHLRNTLQIGNVIGTSIRNYQYSFIRWNDNGGLVFQSHNNEKEIPAEMIIAAHYVKGRIVNRTAIEINYDWVLNNGKNERCIAPVLIHLIDTLGIY